jgi:hypothetical protein
VIRSEIRDYHPSADLGGGRAGRKRLQTQPAAQRRRSAQTSSVGMQRETLALLAAVPYCRHAAMQRNVTLLGRATTPDTACACLATAAAAGGAFAAGAKLALCALRARRK